MISLEILHCPSPLHDYIHCPSPLHDVIRNITLLLCIALLMSILVLQSLARKRELVSLLLLSFGCLVTVNVLWLFLTVLWICLQ